MLALPLMASYAEIFDAEAQQHEDGLALFVSPPWRRRFRESLKDPKRRHKLLARLPHFRHIDHRFGMPVIASHQSVAWLRAELLRRGAPRKRAYLVSEDEDIDGARMPLEDALQTVVGAHSSFATFVSCIPGRLAYFHDEEIDNRYILERLAGDGVRPTEKPSS